MWDYKDKVVIITGGTRGIGLEVGKSFAKAKAHVVLFGSKEETVHQALENFKKNNLEALGYYPNLNDYFEIEKVIKDIYEKYGHIDILINNAGIMANKALEDTTIEEFNNVLDINVKAMFNMIKCVVPYFKKQKEGVILNTSSFVSFYGQALGCPYPASKYAVNGLTKSLARELAPFNIRANAVAPGVIETDMLARISEEVKESVIAKIPLGRIGKPIDIANAYLFS